MSGVSSVSVWVGGWVGGCVHVGDDKSDLLEFAGGFHRGEGGGGKRIIFWGQDPRCIYIWGGGGGQMLTSPPLLLKETWW